jgi:hypothetical protein
VSRRYPVFIGYDPREAVAYHVCQQSIIENCSDPSSLEFHALAGERRDGSNDFIYARFLVPYLCGFAGSAVFMDGDMIVRGDILDLFDLGTSHVGAQVVKHDYLTKHPTKYLGNKNEDYPRKNWSSLILWSCDYFPNRVLTPTYVADKAGSFLHRFQWLKDEQIGELPAEWNRLVLEQEIEPADRLLHYTIGIPAFAEYAACDGAEEWWKTYQRMIEPIK